MKLSCWITFFMCLFLLLSCKGNEKFKVQDFGVQIPKAWSATETTTSETLQPWLNDFDDPQLVQLVDEAIKNNFDLKAAASRMKIALETLKQSGAVRLPEADIQFDYAGNIKPNSTSTKKTDLFNLNLGINWEPDLWGRIGDLKEADLESFRASQSDFLAAQLSLAINVSKLWFNAIEKKEQITLAQRRLESYEKSLKIIQDGYEQGILTELDIRLTRSDLIRAENSLEVEKQEYDKISRALEVLLGKYPLADRQIPDTLVGIKKSVPGGVPSEILIRRPDLIAAEHRLMESEKKLNAANKNRLPSFSLTGQAGTSSDQLIKLLDINYLIISIAGRITQSVFDGGRLKSEREIAKAKKNEKLAEYSQALLKAFQEVETALAKESFLAKQEEHFLHINNELYRAETLALEQYLEGLADIMTYLDTKQRTYDAKRLLVQAVNQRIQNRLDLYLALGGDFKASINN